MVAARAATCGAWVTERTCTVLDRRRRRWPMASATAPPTAGVDFIEDQRGCRAAVGKRDFSAPEGSATVRRPMQLHDRAGARARIGLDVEFHRIDASAVACSGSDVTSTVNRARSSFSAGVPPSRRSKEPPRHDGASQKASGRPVEITLTTPRLASSLPSFSSPASRSARSATIFSARAGRSGTATLYLRPAARSANSRSSTRSSSRGSNSCGAEPPRLPSAALKGCRARHPAIVRCLPEGRRLMAHYVPDAASSRR